MGQCFFHQCLLLLCHYFMLDVCRDLDSDATSCPDISQYLRKMKVYMVAGSPCNHVILGCVYRNWFLLLTRLT